MIEIRDIILIILTIIVIFLLYKNMNKENFGPTQTDINQMIADTYQVDLDAMRNLGQITQKILNNNDSLTLPTNITIPGNLEVTGNVNFTNKNNNILEIFPTYMVIAWATDNIPLGWAICDGETYILDNTGKAILGANGTKTPDLRGRFVLGSGKGTGLTNRTLNDTGGDETHVITKSEMPIHEHYTFYNGQITGSSPITWGELNGVNAGNPNTPGSSLVNNQSSALAAAHNNTDSGNYMILSGGTHQANSGQSSISGNNQPHNNMPPFYVLTYIMKL